ncbi:MAG: DNA polymerase III subunit alpha, partial [Gemmatimonadales bacterium]
LDFPWDERDKVLAYVFQRYPHPRAAMVSNHNCFRLRGALREVAKVHGRPPGEIREVTRRIPWYNEEASLPDLMHTHPNFRALELPAVWRELAALAEPLIGVPRHLSLHPGGVVIAPNALTDYVPIEIAAKQLDGFPDLPVPVIQFEKDGAEDAGLVKIDLLGNRSLAVIRDAIAAVHTHTGRQIDYTTMGPGDDEKTRALFRTGQTMGVFYTESPASRLLCQKSRAETFDLLVLNTSIIRPASNRYIRTYLERLHGKPYEPLAPCLQDVLSDTFGIMVYQEDVVNVCATFAGMPLATGDGLRKALSKKRPHKRLAAYAEEFFAGAAALGRDAETARKVWEMVMSFAGYSFCKGHSCSYIQVAQHSCYLRANYPAEFIAAVLSNGGGFYHPFAYVADALRLGLTVLPPDINESTYRCRGRGGMVRIGFQFVKGLSSAGLDKLEAGRTAGRSDGQTVGRPDGPTGSRGGAGYDPYRSLEDLRRRTGLGNDDLRILIKVGALDSIAQGRTRPMMLWEVDSDGKAEGRKGGTHVPALAIGQSGFEGDRPSFRPSVLPPLREYSASRRRKLEYELLGFTTEGHPMDLFEEQLSRYRVVRSPELPAHVGRHVLCAGLLTTSKPVHTVKDEPMEFATFDDGRGLIETVLFPDVYRNRGHVLFDPGPFLFRGKVEEEFGAVTVTITHLDRLERAIARRSG